MNHRLILVTGSCPSASKTEFIRLLAAGLKQRQIAHDPLLEDDARWSPLVGQLVHDLIADSPNRVGRLLAAARNVVDQLVRMDSVLIVDAMTLMPAFVYLTGHQTRDAIDGYASELWSIVAPTLPLMIYLRCNAEIGLQRATLRSDASWLDNFLSRLKDGRFVLKPSDTGASTATAVQFFTHMDTLGRAAIATSWMGRVIECDTTESPEQVGLKTAHELFP